MTRGVRDPRPAGGDRGGGRPRLALARPRPARALPVGLYRGREPVPRRPGRRNRQHHHRAGRASASPPAPACSRSIRPPSRPRASRPGPRSPRRAPRSPRPRPMPSRPRPRRLPLRPTPTAPAATLIACSRSAATIRLRSPARTSTRPTRRCARRTPGSPPRAKPPRPAGPRSPPPVPRKARRAAASGRSRSASASSRPPAPSAARVEEVFYRPGEWVAANQPVVSLLPDDRVKIRFFVPEQEVARYRPGRSVRFACDGCAGGLAAKIFYVSPRAEFTPPVIFSRDSRDRLVFMVEARPAKAGQPDARPAGRRGAAAVTLAIDVQGLSKRFGSLPGGRQCLAADRAGAHHRLPRPQRLGQDHVAAHAVRAADARQRPAARCSASTSPARPRRSSARPAT